MVQRALMVENYAGAKRVDVENCAGAKCVDGGELCWCNVR